MRPDGLHGFPNAGLRCIVRKEVRMERFNDKRAEFARRSACSQQPQWISRMEAKPGKLQLKTLNEEMRMSSNGYSCRRNCRLMLETKVRSLDMSFLDELMEDGRLIRNLYGEITKIIPTSKVKQARL
jgi:hypothetical protein